MPFAISRSLSIAIITAIAITPASGQCPVDMSNHLCCLSFGHFSDNYEVWEDQCGLNFPNSTTIGGACETMAAPWWVPFCGNMFRILTLTYLSFLSFSGLIALCCASTAGEYWLRRDRLSNTKAAQSAGSASMVYLGSTVPKLKIER